MSRQPAYSDDPEDQDEEDGLDPEGPDESDMDYSDDPDLEVCPHCRKMIYEGAEKCPHCGMYISAEDAPLSRRAWIILAIGIVLLIALLLTSL
jgi:uncharacterized paraquat-inducible protein A